MHKVTLSQEKSTLSWQCLKNYHDNVLRIIIRSESHHAPPNFNSQQNVAKVLQFVIDELKDTSVAASDLISNTIRISVSCNQCFFFSAKEEKLDILTILLSPNINSTLSKCV